MPLTLGIDRHFAFIACSALFDECPLFLALRHSVVLCIFPHAHMTLHTALVACHIPILLPTPFPHTPPTTPFYCLLPHPRFGSSLHHPHHTFPPPRCGRAAVVCLLLHCIFPLKLVLLYYSKQGGGWIVFSVSFSSVSQCGENKRRTEEKKRKWRKAEEI